MGERALSRHARLVIARTARPFDGLFDDRTCVMRLPYISLLAPNTTPRNGIIPPIYHRDNRRRDRKTTLLPRSQSRNQLPYQYYQALSFGSRDREPDKVKEIIKDFRHCFSTPKRLELVVQRFSDDKRSSLLFRCQRTYVCFKGTGSILQLDADITNASGLI